MRKSLALLTFLAANVWITGSARAQDSGLRAAVVVGLERTDSGPGAGAQDGFYYGVQLGRDWRFGALDLGLEAELGESSATGSYLSERASQGLFANAALRVAMPVTPATRVFVRGGYAYHRIDYAMRADFSGSGYTAGGGLEQDLGGPLFLRGEYRFSDYGEGVRGQHFVGSLGLKF